MAMAKGYVSMANGNSFTPVVSLPNIEASAKRGPSSAAVPVFFKKILLSMVQIIITTIRYWTNIIDLKMMENLICLYRYYSFSAYQLFNNQWIRKNLIPF